VIAEGVTALHVEAPTRVRRASGAMEPSRTRNDPNQKSSLIRLFARFPWSPETPDSGS
jgi:hypothetical protein